MSNHVFRVRYFGTTGTFPRPLSPTDVVDKIADSIADLSERRLLADLIDRPKTRQEVRELVQRHLPFPLRSTYGGNTTCIQIQTADEMIILDAGSGLRKLGIELEQSWGSADYEGSRSAHVLLSHAHMDHTFATPVFDPFFNDKNQFHIWGPRSAIDSLDTILSPDSSFGDVYFPITFLSMNAVKGFHVIEEDEHFRIGQTNIKTFALNHPGGCLAFRLERDGRAIVFASDHEHAESPDLELAEFAAGADLMYTDAQYQREEYEGRIGIHGEPPVSRGGWGHSCVEDVIPTAVASGVSRVHLGHHEPKRTDQQLAEFEARAKDLYRQALKQDGKDTASSELCLAYEGLTVEI